MATDSQTADNALRAGEEALRSGAWAAARGHFEAALAPGESGEAWEGLGWAGYWLHDAELTIGAREHAYRAFRAEAQPGAAARVAGWLAADFLEFRGEDAVARGWLERGRRVLEGVPAGEDHGWLALLEGSYVMNVLGDLEEAAVLAAQGAALGREFGVADLEAVGLALEGITLVRRGGIQEGLRLLDEAAAITAGEELRLPIVRGWALCYLISACEGVGDFPRATQWCATVQGIAERWDARQLMGICRSAYGNVLATNGDWAAAELELTEAVDDLLAARPAMAPGGVARLGELRARQGRTDEARGLFERAGSHQRALIGLGSLALEAGDPAAAADAAERVLRRLGPATVLDRLPALELLVRARLSLGDLEAAAATCAELEQVGDMIGTPFVRGRAHLAAARLAAARGDFDEARRACEDALDLLAESGAAYETALAQHELARALAALGRAEAAAAAAKAGQEGFAALGVQPPGRAADSLSELTPRELEVLRLVAQGLSDADIAERLVLSQHTVHRHVANVRTKLGLPSRAAAVAYAARAGLL